MHDQNIRPVDPKYAPNGQTSFADGFPFLIAAEECLQDLNTRLLQPMTMERFRPASIVIMDSKKINGNKYVY
jgi:uncharacterized protein YcbX